MDLYFAPLACSMATRIALYEAGADAQYIQRDRNKRLPDGSDFLQINPLGMVPTLRTDDGDLLTENAAILQYVAEQFPNANMAAVSGRERRDPAICRRAVSQREHGGRLRPRARAAAAVAELHRHRVAQGGLSSAAAARRAARGEDLRGRPRRCAPPDRREAPWRSRIPARPFHGRGRLPVHGAELEHGDAGEFDRFPAIQDYIARLQKRPSIARAVGEELALYNAARSKAA